MFTPPITADLGRVEVTLTGVEARLARHLHPLPRGRNVYIVNGVATEDPPADQSTITRTFFGGHVGEEVSAAEVTILTAAGYGSNIV